MSKGDRVIVVGKLQQRSYEAEVGRRYVIEVQASHVSPDLGFETAKVTRRKTSSARGDKDAGESLRDRRFSAPELVFVIRLLSFSHDISQDRQAPVVPVQLLARNAADVRDHLVSPYASW